ncbi:NAD+ synthase [Leptolyngbya iicbica]|uniref:Glutamine-dependent NAD(+) synthetase n=2 Tax=Cyanophyceae TaxID=3028117 RepID=A0A4Q7E697_9CYAN|nr:NAD+ synthase [Leptolyngbya sp. LK]RZM75703.1 NAD+ synthase [Leptolyngbya sp. LK]
MKIAIAQLNPTIGDLTHNAEQIVAAVKHAAAGGARLVLTPELSLCGYPPRDLLLRPGFIAAMRQQLEGLAAALPPEVAVLVGFAEPNAGASDRGEKPLYNSIAYLEQGQVQQVFHKQLLPTYDVFDEDRYFEPGQVANHFYLALADSQSLHIGVTICEDLWNDEQFWGQRKYPHNPIAQLKDVGVDLVVNLSASPFTAQKQQTREAMLAHSARRFDVPIVYANQIGANDDLIFDGNSVAVNRQGELVTRARAFQPDLQWLTYDPPSADLQAGAIAPATTDINAEIWSALVLGVGDYARKCGFRKAVIGLSGGIDSALVAAIAAAALGPENVLGVLMPSPYSSDHSLSDAEQLVQNLGIQSETLAIGTLMAGYDETLSNLFADTEFGVAEENIQSRIRGNLLMAIANKFGHLLLSTGNKSEMAVGYCTLYGDMNGGLAVIADVPKTRVYRICDWLNQHPEIFPDLAHSGQTDPIIPANILTKAPSAELKPGQVDQDSLPSYEVLDDILERLVQRHEAIGDIVAAGHDVEIVNKVVRLMSRAEFKRRQAPPVLKVTDRAFGSEWRMPIASRWTGNLAPQPAIALASTAVS